MPLKRFSRAPLNFPLASIMYRHIWNFNFPPGNHCTGHLTKLFAQVHVIQYNLVNCVLIEVIISTLIILKNKNYLVSEKNNIWIKRRNPSTNLFFLVPWAGTFGHNSFHIAGHLTSILVPGAGEFDQQRFQKFKCRDVRYAKYGPFLKKPELYPRLYSEH